MRVEGTPLHFGRVAIARVRRHERWFVERYLHLRERALALALKVDKRRVDFVAGRVAVKRALGGEGAPAAACVLPAVGAREGAPELVDGGKLARSVSISHGGSWAVAAAVEDARVGIDVERIEARDVSFVREAFADGELSTWADALGAGADDARVITVAWCAKEALLKVAGSGLRSPLPAMIPSAIELRTGDAPLAVRGRVRTVELGVCDVALELAAGHAVVVAWSEG